MQVICYQDATMDTVEQQIPEPVKKLSTDQMTRQEKWDAHIRKVDEEYRIFTKGRERKMEIHKDETAKQEEWNAHIRKVDEEYRIFTKGIEREMEIHKDHPVIILIKRLQSNPLTKQCADIVKYRLGKMDPNHLQAKWLYPNTPEHHSYIQMCGFAVKMVCPNAKFVSKTYYYDWGSQIERYITWKEGEMDEIISNEFIFPNKK